MWIVRLALRRPYTFIVMAVLLFILGPLAIMRTPTDIFPNIDIPVVSIVWSYNGFSAEDMAHRITSNYERALTTDVDDIEHIESQSLNGVSVVKIFFHPGADINRAIAEAASNSASILRILPPGTLPPNIITYNASTVPVLQLGLSSDTLPEQKLYDLGNSFIRTQLATVQGAAVPLPFGGKIRQIMVELDPKALQAKGLAPIDVVNAVNAQNLILPGGTAKIGSREYNVEMNGSTQTVAALNDLPIKTVQGGVVYVRDVAHVIDGYAPQTNIVRSDGKRAALLQVEKTGSASTLTIIQQVKDMLPKISAGLPKALHIIPLSDQSVFVKAAISGVVREALIAACLTAAMILLFLGSWRATLIIAVTIPLAVLTSLIALAALGQTINIMTLGGLALAVGILVDDATVAIENITHHLEKGEPLHDAILNGSGEIAVPTFVSTMSICIVFVPMFLLSGVARYLFVPLAEAVVFAMCASYFFSRTLIPTLAMYLMRAPSKEEHAAHGRFAALARFQARFERHFEALRSGYRAMLGRAIAGRRRFLPVYVALCLASLTLVPFAGRDFFPAVDTGQIRLHLRAPTGTRIEETARITDQVEAKIRSVIPASDQAAVLDNIGVPVSGINLTYDSSDPVGPEDADILVTLQPKHKPTAQYVAQLRNVLAASFPGVTFAFLPADIVSQILNFGLPAPIDVQIVGNQLDKNRVVADRLLAQLRGVRGLVDARIQQPGDAPTIDVNVDRTKAIQAGLTQRDVAQNMLIALSGSSQTTPNFWLDPKNGVSYPLLAEVPQYDIDSLQTLSNIPLTTNPATVAPQNQLGTLGTLKRSSQQAVVSHYNVQPVLDIFAATQGRDLGSVAADVSRIVDAARAQLPPGSSIVMRGQVQSMNESFAGLGAGLVFAIALVYLLMVVNFQSWLDPLIIISGLPASLAGIAWMLFATHTTLSVPALTGTILCIGIATANSILVINTARESLQAGMEPLAAALDAGFNRFRPVLMTALAMLIGMLPMALGLGDGGEQNAPLGRAVIGGLAFGTLSTLMFVPVVFGTVHAWLARRRAARSAAVPVNTQA
ncbi:efflux RND transporter permease subunit [bacterium M00.F.Ca.ET.228.01.1.1]|uniref:efflux RND transporter permease subunit n=1 Tax=Paraburkholderia phenoliruptrix TaxID=252970 RepID=UPI001091B96F|nr:efflux RND transporter permease subunit [Paraburkholderia phenoliruptrix]TGP42469.1 efflux RND transporter permease subunit [bacterium M00.F.Ca.ET.228.01.1.1]TGS00120.1 efflux RND transporter permease subunit [bacterium M00.F.Ca.ET.191.01.1.1]TGU04440.1 efflux RND transporter permease subunit [bacterium M00.F.Ca.ET.155.01.1.1]MBW0449948.1 efflux RND transporter permease subunit [Paraburkholderia phenoliruptrix]MBW9098700.1 efflux RND transporter permease subunit [Paraburkholderia phenolirup